MTEQTNKDKPIEVNLPDEQYVIPYDDVNGSNMSSMLANMAHCNNIAQHLLEDNIDDYKERFVQLHAKYRVFLYKWLRRNWDSLDKERQDFAKPFYRKGRMIL